MNGWVIPDLLQWHFKVKFCYLGGQCLTFICLWTFIWSVIFLKEAGYFNSASNFHETFTRSSLAIIYVDPIGPFQAKFNFSPQNTCCSLAGWQNLAAFVGSKNANENFCQVRIYNFRVKCVVFARNRKFANLIQYNMQYMPCVQKKLSVAGAMVHWLNHQ